MNVTSQSPQAEKSIEHVLDQITKPRRRRKRSARHKMGKVGASLHFAAEAMRSETESPEADHMRGIVASDNVLGIGISEKESEGKATGLIALTFYVERKKSKGKLSPAERVPPEVPTTIDATKIVTDVKAIGRLRPELNARRKPFQPGNSVGHIDATAGTLGAVVSRNGEIYILSNSHVLALAGTAKRGDAIVYPGVFDGGALEDDLVAKLARFTKFTPGTAFVNRVDCALAKPTPERLGDLLSEIKGLGLPGRTTIKPVRGMKVVKVGRTTGKTTGKIQDVHFRFTLDYEGSVGKVGFIDQVLCTRYTDEGDSGSLVLDKATGRAVGLHFAGAEGGSVFSPIDDVLKSLGCKLVTKSLQPSSKGKKKSPK
jgi:hypothetical protein